MKKIYIKENRRLNKGTNDKTGNKFLGTPVRELNRDEGEKACRHTKKVLDIVKHICTTDEANHNVAQRVSSRSQLTTLYREGRITKRNSDYTPHGYKPKDPKWYTGEEICIDIQKRLDDFLDNKNMKWLPEPMFNKLDKFMEKVIATVEKRNAPYGKEASEAYKRAWEECRIEWIKGVRPKNTFNDITEGVQ